MGSVTKAVEGGTVQNTSLELDSMAPSSSRGRGGSGRGKSLSGYDDDIADVNQGKIGLSDFKQILPTCLILIVTLLITVTVIPYAFSSVIKQMQAADRMEEWRAEQTRIASREFATATTPIQSS